MFGNGTALGPVTAPVQAPTKSAQAPSSYAYATFAPATARPEYDNGRTPSISTTELSRSAAEWDLEPGPRSDMPLSVPTPVSSSMVLMPVSRIATPAVPGRPSAVPLPSTPTTSRVVYPSLAKPVAIPPQTQLHSVPIPGIVLTPQELPPGEAAPSWWDSQSQTTKAAIGIGLLVAIGAGVYYVTKK